MEKRPDPGQGAIPDLIAWAAHHEDARADTAWRTEVVQRVREEGTVPDIYRLAGLLGEEAEDQCADLYSAIPARNLVVPTAMVPFVVKNAPAAEWQVACMKNAELLLTPDEASSVWCAAFFRRYAPVREVLSRAMKVVTETADAGEYLPTMIRYTPASAVQQHEWLRDMLADAAHGVLGGMPSNRRGILIEEMVGLAQRTGLPPNELGIPDLLESSAILAIEREEHIPATQSVMQEVVWQMGLDKRLWPEDKKRHFMNGRLLEMFLTAHRDMPSSSYAALLPHLIEKLRATHESMPASERAHREQRLLELAGAMARPLFSRLGFGAMKDIALNKVGGALGQAMFEAASVKWLKDSLTYGQSDREGAIAVIRADERLLETDLPDAHPVWARAAGAYDAAWLARAEEAESSIEDDLEVAP